MDLTVLVTFLLDSIPKSHSVQLFGSWDNFSVPYPMQKDKQKGHGHWTGCHTFKNIVCDGDPSQIVEPRDGGLKVGGTYWYYYLLNNDLEYYDPARPSTNACPLLPGQTVNILEIPTCQTCSSTTMNSDDLDVEKLLTLDPNARYVKPVPPPKKRKRAEADPPALTQDSQAHKSHIDWMARSVGRLQTGVVDTIIHTFTGYKMLNLGSNASTSRPRSAPAASCSLVAGTYLDGGEGNSLSRMESCKSSVRRPHGRRGFPTRDGMLTRTASNKSVVNTGNPFEALQEQHRGEQSIFASFLEHVPTSQQDELHDVIVRPATWQHSNDWTERCLQVLAPDNDHPMQLLGRPITAPPSFPEQLESESLSSHDMDLGSNEEPTNLGRLSAIMEVDAEASFEAERDVSEGLQSPECDFHAPGSSGTKSDVERHSSRKSLRARSNAMFSLRASKRSSGMVSRSSSLNESVRSLENTNTGSQTEGTSVGTSLRSSTSSVPTGWTSPEPCTQTSTTHTSPQWSKIHHDDRSDKPTLSTEARLNIGDIKLLSAALDSQETIKPIERRKENIRLLTDEEANFAKLSEHVEFAFESGRFDNRSWDNRDTNQDLATISNNGIDMLNLTSNGAFYDLPDDSHDDIMADLSYLGSFIK